MRAPLRRRGLLADLTAVLALLAAAGPATAAPRADAGAGDWGRAHEIIDAGPLAGADVADLTLLSCAAPGYCAVAGTAGSPSGRSLPFVASEVRGSWGRARLLPGLHALDHGKTAGISAISCGSPRNCVAGGRYFDAAGLQLPFVAAEVNGRWRAATEVPGMTAFNRGRSAQVTAVSCPAAGDCLVGGSYRDAARRTTQAFVAREVNGTWRPPAGLPGGRALNAGGDATINSLACGSPGNCAAAGSYADSANQEQAFVASEVRGSWRAAVEVPGLAALNQGGFAYAASVSCGAMGTCAAGGQYADSAKFQHAFVVSEAGGRWRPAREVPGIPSAAPHEPFSATYTLSCAAGGCAAGGAYRGPGGHLQAFVVRQVRGTWGRAVELPGIAGLNRGGSAGVNAISCPAAGSCTAAGIYTDGRSHPQAFVAAEAGGAWRRAREVPGTAALNTGGFAEAAALSCPAPARCAVSGIYQLRSHSLRGFTADEK
jgi:hypothetical protein